MDDKPARKPRFSIIVFIGVIIGMVFIGADIITLSLRPLTYLGVAFPSVLKYTHFIAPGIAFVIWILFRRWGPNLVAIVGIALCITVISSVATWGDHQVAKVKITIWINSNDIPSLETRLGFKVWEEGDASGNQLWVARVPDHIAPLTAETKRMGILRP